MIFSLFSIPKKCEMHFEVQGKTDNFVQMVKDGNGVEFLSSRTLVEYEIQSEALEVTSHHNVSVAKVKIVFRRQMMYHVASTILQVQFFLVSLGFQKSYYSLA